MSNLKTMALENVEKELKELHDKLIALSVMLQTDIDRFKDELSREQRGDFVPSSAVLHIKRWVEAIIKEEIKEPK